MTVAVVTVSALALVNAVAGPGLVMIGLLVAGPCLAAVSGSPRAVLAVGAYATLLVLALSWWPYRLAGTSHQLMNLLGVVTVTGVSLLVTRRHRVLEHAAGQGNAGRRLLAAIVDSSDDAIITKTLDGIITSWNSGAARMYGYHGSEAIGKNISMIADPVEAAELLDILARLRRGERIDHYETRRFCKDGTVKVVSVTISPVRDDAGTVIGASAVARDISDRKEAEAHRQLVEQSSQQAQRLQSLGQLAGGIAHDFNNVLAVIGSYAEFAEEQTADDSPVQAAIDATLTDPQLVLPPGSYARLVVSDTGSGMCASVVAHIFEPFFSTKPKDQATGLGLATVHGIVRQAGGDIGVYSEPHLGTTIRLYLPTTESSVPGPTPPAVQPPQGHGQTILVVEDEDEIRRLVVRILDNNGFRGLGASRGSQALTLADQHHCDLLLTDVVMPEMSGPRLGLRMRQHHPGMPVLLMSGYSDGLLAGRGDGTDLIQKPFTASELLRGVDAALTQPSHRSSPAQQG